MKAKNSLFLALSLFCLSQTNTQNKENWNGDFYEEHSSMQQESANMLLDSIDFKGTESVLDIGCGDGKITASVAKKTPQGSVVGIDISQNMISAAQEKHGHIPNLTFHLTGATTFTFDQKFDYAITFYVLHWIKDTQKVLANIKNVLKPGGKLFVKMATKLDECPIQGYFNNLNPNGPWGSAKLGRATNFFNKNVDAFEAMLYLAGFENHYVRVVYESFYFEGFEKLVLWFMGWMPNCIKLSDEKNLEFCRELVQHLYAQQSKKIDESFVLTFPILYVEAQA